ncbi:hypothetical protein GALMADRAFT_213537 [Galerina marginata CBS 339.88]|uniref:DUF6533 domain-containing protein n=1 Tax=Galerina marginata (strain CBS 339.88) TaxID=685588 RepID=A0A067SZB1_GALM3|nr:hypothetical protein GALMADRAFT_213537 [Galerina marginata CBS 339.88]
MSSPSELSPVLITAYQDIQLVQFTRLSSSAIIIYDHILTFDREGSEWSLTKILFLMNRYFALSCVILRLKYSHSYKTPSNFTELYESGLPFMFSFHSMGRMGGVSSMYACRSVGLVYLVCLVIWITEPDVLLDAPIGYSVALSCTLGSRLILNIRESATIVDPSKISNSDVQFRGISRRDSGRRTFLTTTPDIEASTGMVSYRSSDPETTSNGTGIGDSQGAGEKMFV